MGYNCYNDYNDYMRKLKVGFDLDGVILYNPLRTLRPVAEVLKPFIFLQKNPDSFYLPKTGLEKIVWRLLHKTSYKKAEGLSQLRKLVKKGRVEAYLITGRYSILEEDFKNWLKKLSAEKIFTDCFFNKNDYQPNFFKETVIKRLGLDIFVEDNWGIIKRLNSVSGKTKIFWITNFLDQNIPYPYKFGGLKEVVDHLAKMF